MSGRWDQWDQEEAGEPYYRQPPGGQGFGQSAGQSFPSRANPTRPYGSAARGAVSARSRGQPPARKRGSAGPIIGLVVSLLAVLALVAFFERGQLTALLRRGSTPTTTPALVLPAFSDWRVAYAGQDGLLHAVSLDGATDVAGAALPALIAGATGSTGAAASPDGRSLAYMGSGPVLVNLTAQQGAADAIRSGATMPSTFLWSPDSAHLASLGADGAVHLATVPALADAAVPATQGKGIKEVIGWVDATHLAVRVLKPNTTSEQAEALDTATGQLRLIVSLTLPGFGALHYRLSPDGARLLTWNTPVSGQPFTAILRAYDTKSGAVHKLPVSSKAVGTTISAAAWRPGAATVAVTSGSAETHNLKLWLVDADHDTATSLSANVYPLGWLSDGTVLIGGSALTGKIGGGPYTLTAYTFPASGAPTHVTLTDKAMSFPWLGLVRTAGA